LKLKIGDILVGSRYREEMGDISALADSIAKYGLFHPVVVDDQNRLIAGGRRIEACNMLGWKEIPVTLFGELSDKQLKEIEFEENIQRKDLTEIEKSKVRLEYAEYLKEKLDESSNNGFGKVTLPKPLGGRPEKSNSLNKIASVIGVTKQTLIDDKHHVESVKKYPKLEQLPKKDAIKTAKTLDTLPAEERPKVLDKIKKPEPKQAEQKTPGQEERDKQLRRAQNFKTNLDRLLERLFALSKHQPEEYFEGLDEIEWAFNGIPVFAENSLSMIDQSIEWLKGFREEYAKRVVNKPREIRRVK